MNSATKKSALVLTMLIISLASALGVCEFSPTSKNTGDFMNEITSLNDKLAGCPVPLNTPAKIIFGSNQMVQLTIARSSGTTEKVLFKIAGGNLAGLSNGGGNHGYEILMGDCEFDAVLNGGFGAFSYLYLQGKIKIVPKGFLNRIKFGTAMLFAKGSLKKAAVPVTLSCLKDNGAVCQHGGECTSGNCIGEGQGPPWTYRCSCDPSTYKTSCPVAPAPQVDASGKRPAGEICQHGGECTTGNCVGVGQGPPWTYRCSCDPFKYVTGC